MKKYWLESIILAIGLGVFGFLTMQGLTQGLGLVMNGLDHFAQKDRVVTVRGLAEMEVPANKVTWPLVYREMGNDLKELHQKIGDNNRKLREFLTTKGIAEAEISENPPEIHDAEADRYNSQPITNRYIATAGLTVTSDKVDLVRQLVTEQGALMEQGIALSTGMYENRVTYAYTGLNDVKPQMIETATKNAREAADKFAQDSGSKLGKMTRAQQGFFSIEDRDEHTPHIKNIRVVTTVDYALVD